MKKKNTIFRALLASSLATTLLLAGCGGGSQETTAIKDDGAKPAEASEKVVLTFWDENAGPERTPYYEELIKQFEAENPNIDIEYVGIPNKSSKQKYDASIAANDTPDVGGVQTSWIADFSAREALVPMDEYFNQWSEKDKMNKGAIEFNRSVSIDGKLYQLPTMQNIDILWYRPDWYQEAGLKAPENWDEFFTAVEKMTDKGQNRFGFTIRGGKGGSFQLQRMMYAYSGIGEYFDANGKSTVNDPKHVEFVEKYLGIYKKYTPESDITNAYKEMIAGFDTGAVALVQHNIGSFGEHSKALQPGQYAALPLPKTADGKYTVEGGNTNGYAIFKTTKHPDEAWKFVSFLGSAKSQSYWNQKVGLIPTNSEVLNEQWVKDAQHIQTAFAVLEDPNTVFYNPPFYLPDYRSILDNIVDPGIQAVMSGKKSTQDFLDEWAAAMEKSKQQFDSVMKK
ncbi:sugar ABC transporter substrate-binding protein [Ammoniphilus sp. 3BR4]|uniref:ABC transporter substrate-binding protein n=1 Tax=Ammoniphilus sp. 3BR4 TaxID=3158265 RepID=UPI0034674173